MEQRLIDANAYAAEMKTRQDACLELMNEAMEQDNEEMYAQKRAAFSVFVEAKLTLDNMPTVDAVPVVHSYWIEGEEIEFCGKHKLPDRCARCGRTALDEPWTYCPNCGARMDGKENDDV